MLPELFCERMKRMLSEDEYDSFIESFSDDSFRYHALRINGLKADEDFKDKIDGILEAVPWEESGFYYGDDAEPGKSPFHEAGLYYIQEPSAMAPVHFLDPKPGEKILDLCAAPGGKSTQIACRMKGEGILVTNEINRDRARILSLNIERLGISNALVLNEDSGHLSEVFEGYFDKILVDAPCSGEGMFRKNDNACDEWSPENVKLCSERQEEILSNAAKMLLPGGRLVYSTCTFAPAENEESILSFLARHSDFHVECATLIGGMEHGKKEYVSEELINSLINEGISKDRIDDCLLEVNDSVRLWPNKLKGEGHFLCVLKRDGEKPVNDLDKYVPGGRNIPAKKEIVKIFEEFAKDTLVFEDADKKLLKSGRSLAGNTFMFGDQLYLSDEKMPSIKGLKVMRPGLHLGTIKKDRFEPSHALFLFLKKQDVVNTIDFASQSDDIRQYINGQTLRGTLDDKMKGWVLVTCDGYSIGFGKAAGGMLKNHYPKGLRINY
jgi:NOL1/NOP2/sun family putative RNA methylase